MNGVVASTSGSLATSARTAASYASLFGSTAASGMPLTVM